MMISNIRGILANDEENNELKEKIEEKLKEFKNLQFKNVKIIKMSRYDTVFLQVKADDNMTMKEYISVERELKSQLKASNELTRFIDIEPL